MRYVRELHGRISATDSIKRSYVRVRTKRHRKSTYWNASLDKSALLLILLRRENYFFQIK